MGKKALFLFIIITLEVILLGVIIFLVINGSKGTVDPEDITNEGDCINAGYLWSNEECCCDLNNNGNCDKYEEPENCVDECSEPVCSGEEGKVYYDCVLQENNCFALVYKGLVIGKCGVECIKNSDCKSDEKCFDNKCEEDIATFEICNNKDDDGDQIIDEGCDDDEDGYWDQSLSCEGYYLAGSGSVWECRPLWADCNDNDKDVTGPCCNKNGVCDDNEDVYTCRADCKPVAAFPGAEGGGAESVGGRSGRIIEVTNLNKNGPGSLREACEATGPRIVVFKVAGIIDLEGTPIIIKNPYITIAGQTAPGEGITIKGHELAIQTYDVMVRYLTVRTGAGDYGAQEGDGIGLRTGSNNVIIDHCSISWSNDENAEAWSSGGDRAAHKMTFSNNLIAEGLTYDHPSCGLIVGGSEPVDVYGTSIHHNLFMNGNNRFPLVSNRDARVVNNIMYNWNWWATGFAGGIKIDIIGNKYKVGPVWIWWPLSDWDLDNCREIVWTGDECQTCGVQGIDPSVYIKGNIGYNQTDPNADNWNMIDDGTPTFYGTGKKLPREFERHIPMDDDYYPISIDSVLDLEAILLSDVGASERINEYGNWVSNRDDVDKRLIQEYIDGEGIIPVDESDVGGYPDIDPGTPYQDTDHDGMSDIWETEHGLDPNDGSDSSGTDLSSEGYTNIEVFINGQAPV